MKPEEVTEDLIDLAMRGANPGCRYDAAFYLANVLPTLTEAGSAAIRAEVSAVRELEAEVRQLTEDRDQASNLSDMRAKLLREAWDAHHNTMDERDALLADRDRAREVAVALEQENARLRDQMAAVEKFAAARAEYITAINNCPPDNSADYWRWQGHAEGRRQLSQTLDLPVAWPAGYEGGEH